MPERPLNASTGHVAPPAPPLWIDDEAAEVWSRLAGEMPAGRLTALDLDAFAVLCTAVVHHRRAARIVNELGPLIRRAGSNTRGATSTNVGVAKNPALQVVRDQASIIAAYATQFGLTPAARAALTKDTDDDDDDGESGEGWLRIVPTA